MIFSWAVRKARFLPRRIVGAGCYACSQNGHPGDSAGTHIFRASQALNSNILIQALKL